MRNRRARSSPTTRGPWQPRRFDRSADRGGAPQQLRLRDRQQGLDVFGAAVEGGRETVEGDPASDQPLEDAGPSPLALLEILQSHFEVTAVGVHRPKRYPVAENHLQVDNVRRDLDTAIAGRHPGEAEDTVGPDLWHFLQRHPAPSGRVGDEGDLTSLLPDSQPR